MAPAGEMPGVHEAAATTSVPMLADPLMSAGQGLSSLVAGRVSLQFLAVVLPTND